MAKELLQKACEWIDNPKRDYDEGVTLFRKLGKNRNLMRFFERKGAARGMVTLLYNLEKLTGHKFSAEKKDLTDDELKALFIDGKREGFDYYEAKRLVSIFDLKPKSKSKEDVFAAIAAGSLKSDPKNDNPPAPGDSNESKDSGRLRVKKHPNINYDELPKDLQILFDENGKLGSDKKSIHAKMTALGEESANDDQRKVYAQQLESIEKSQAANWKVIDDWWNNKDKTPGGDKQELDPVQQAQKDAEEKAKQITNLKSQASRRTGKLKNMSEDDPKRKKTQEELDSIVEQLRQLGVEYKPRK